MDARTLSIFFLLLTPVVIQSWQTLDSASSGELRRPIHYHSKRHDISPRESERKRRISTPRPKEYRKKPTGYLKPLQEDDIENDEVVSVAIGPPAMRPKYDKIFRHPPKTVNRTVTTSNVEATAASNLVKDVLVQIGREFLTRQVNEDFVFGQYVGNSMRNLTNDLRLRMQHEVLDLIMKYQKLSRGEVNSAQTMNSPEEKLPIPLLKETKVERKPGNDTDEAWPDFTNLANIVG